MSSQTQASAMQHLQLLSIRAFTFGFQVPGKTTTACLAAACCFVGISFILLGEVASNLYLPFLPLPLELNGGEGRETRRHQMWGSRMPSACPFTYSRFNPGCEENSSWLPKLSRAFCMIFLKNHFSQIL